MSILTCLEAGPPEVPVEPLAESAPLARQWAAQHCTDCDWYHGFWQHMRLMGLGKTLSGQALFFLTATAKWRNKPGLRVLVSGCADYSALAYAVAGLGRTLLDGPAPPQWVVLDRCETPLRLSRWYAEKMGLPAQTVQTVQSDILNYQPTALFNLIITSGFMGYFDPQQRVRLFAQYGKLLAPGGRLVFANRLRDLPEDQAIGFGASEAATFMARAQQANAALAPQDQLEDARLAQDVQAYCAQFKSYPVSSNSLMDSLSQAGLKAFGSALVQGKSKQGPDLQQLSGPTLADDSNYILVEAGSL